MKLKYYLRGLGIGIAVTALVLALAGGGKESLTDAEIIERAKALGMVESVTLSQLSSESNSEHVSEEVSEEDSIISSEDAEKESSSENISETTENEEVSEPVSEETTSEEASAEPSEDISEESSETVNETPSEENIDEYVIVEIGAGDGSDTVSRKLEELGMVEDARMYDDFLCGNGYDKILQTGVHEIPRTADWDMIAEILAGRM